MFIANRRKVFNFLENGVAGHPDGMTIDSNGNLWIACFDGSQVCTFLDINVFVDINNRTETFY